MTLPNLLATGNGRRPKPRIAIWMAPATTGEDLDTFLPIRSVRGYRIPAPRAQPDQGNQLEEIGALLVGFTKTVGIEAIGITELFERAQIFDHSLHPETPQEIEAWQGAQT